MNIAFRPVLAQAALTPVPQPERDRYAAMDATPAAHAEALAAVPCFREIAQAGAMPDDHAAPLVRVAAWNIERGLYPEACADLLRRHGVDIALLSEVDDGCHRTGQRDVTAAIAGALGHASAYGVEFLELATMPQPIALADTTLGNRLGFHGNAITSAVPLRAPVVIRLDEVADWWTAPRGGQRRIGTRMGIAATFTAAATEFVACAVHLESDSDAPGRARQMATLLDALDEYADGRPVIVGGDLNVAVQPGGHDDPQEWLFAQTEARGYDWNACNAMQPTTRPSVWSPGAETRALDWFCTRGLVAEAPEVVPALGPDGTVLSDHDLLLVTLRLGQC
jgi:endonuclease/exonuclease/phosphatase family metal-dependent hydrolase